tara:strand:- start:390 stop:626 length:237 start_codon:yes stop_codon:yes gene_type:complete
MASSEKMAITTYISLEEIKFPKVSRKALVRKRNSTRVLICPKKRLGMLSSHKIREQASRRNAPTQNQKMFCKLGGNCR